MVRVWMVLDVMGFAVVSDSSVDVVVFTSVVIVELDE